MGQTHDGGKPAERDVMNYKPPLGPRGIDNVSEGLGGFNYGHREIQPDARVEPKPPQGIVNHGCGGSQGRH